MKFKKQIPDLIKLEKLIGYSFNDKDISHSFTEKVKYLDLEKFETYFSAAGLKINHIFGNYQLSKFNSDTSDRLIFVAS